MHILAPNQTVEKYPYSIGELRRDNPNTSFPRNPSDALLADWDVFPVQPTEYPQVDYTKNVTEGTPTLQDGVWVQVWDVTDASAEEIAQRLKDMVPLDVTMRQARLALLGAGLLNQIEDAIAALPSPQKEAAQIEWEYAQQIDRHNGLVDLLTPALGLTEQQVDDLFISAATL